jgi:hypothetical protein
MLRRVALVRIDVSEELRASIIRVTRIGELGTTLAVTSKRRTLRRNTRATHSVNIPEDGILQSVWIFYTWTVIDTWLWLKLSRAPLD